MLFYLIFSSFLRKNLCFFICNILYYWCGIRVFICVSAKDAGIYEFAGNYGIILRKREAVYVGQNF